MWHISSSVYFPEENLHTITGLIVGIFTDFTVAILLGIIIIYVLYYTGTESYLIKSTVIGLFSWLFAFGVVLQSNIVRVTPEENITVFAFFIGHLLIGFVVGLVAKKYGQGLLFFDQR